MTQDERGAAGELRVQVLGPVRAWRGEQELRLGAPRQAAVLAVLAMQAGRAVSRDELIDSLWDEPPRNAVNSVHIYVKGLRDALEPDRGRRSAGRVLVTAVSGYELRLEPGQVDMAVFDQQVAAARRLRAGGDPAGTARLLGEALRLAQGGALTGVAGPWARIGRVRLEEARLTALEERAEAMLALGCHAELAAELSGLVREHPYRERFRCQLMLALYRCGRQADALEVFREARRLLDAELGIEPGPELRGLHGQMLAADAALDLPAAAMAPAAGWRTMPVPRELPSDVAAFIGRAGELAELDRLLPGAGGGEPAAVVISAVSGTAGVGKTALAVRWAHRASGRFPDGQLYVNLRGYDPGQPVTTADALAGFLRALGMTDTEIPPEAQERASRYRSLLAGRRMLVVLDNAREAEQVRLLLPGTAPCAVLVTSRDSLAGLVALHGAARLDLDLLPLDDAVALLRALIGGRADADPEAAAALAARCARLPLALRVAAELAAARPADSLADLAAELRDEQRRLDLLDAGGDARSAVRAVFSWSCQQLDDAAADAFRRLGLHPGPDFSLPAAAALVGTTVPSAAVLLGRLARAHLIQPAGAGRYAMHGLLRSYAAEQASRDPAASRDRALGRLLDYYQQAAAPPDARPAHQDRPAAARSAEDTGRPDGAAALAWARTERGSLLGCLDYATATGQLARVVALTAAVGALLRYDGPWADAVTRHAAAATAAGSLGDRLGQACALSNLGTVRKLTGDLPGAALAMEEALGIFRDLGDRPGQARALDDLGLVRRDSDDCPGAAQAHADALAIFRDLGDRSGQARALSNLGTVRRLTGDLPAAAQAQEEALGIFRDLGDRLGRAGVLLYLGGMRRDAGDLTGAARAMEDALGIYRDLGHRSGQANALHGLGAARLKAGDLPRAARSLEEALEISRDLGYQLGQANASSYLGLVRRAAGDLPGAAEALAEALEICRATGDAGGEANALLWLGGVRREAGDLPGAAQALADAMDIYHGRYPGGEMEVLNEAGALHRACGDLPQAWACHQKALDLAQEIGSPWDEASALAGLGRCALAAGDLVGAEAALRGARKFFQLAGAPEASAVSAELDLLTRQGSAMRQR